MPREPSNSRRYVVSLVCFAPDSLVPSTPCLPCRLRLPLGRSRLLDCTRRPCPRSTAYHTNLASLPPRLQYQLQLIETQKLPLNFCSNRQSHEHSANVLLWNSPVFLSVCPRTWRSESSLRIWFSIILSVWFAIATFSSTFCRARCRLPTTSGCEYNHTRHSLNNPKARTSPAVAYHQLRVVHNRL